MSDELVLPELVRRESRSFLQYIREAFPWAKSQDAATRDAILRMANAEAAFAAKLGAMLQKRRIPVPGLGAFPTSFTGSNFLAASALLPKLTAAERQSLADLERDLFRVTDDATRTALESYRELKRTHLAELEALAGTAPVAA